MNKERDEKLLKSWLKRKITITTSTVVAFLITGLIISTPIYASVLIGATENDNLTVTKTNNQGSKVDNSGITIGGAISKAGNNSVHIGDYSGSMGTRNVVIGTNASAGYDAKRPDDNPPKDDTFNQSVAIGAGSTAGEGARAYGDQSIAIGSNTIARGNSSIAIGNDDVDKTGSTNTTYTDLNGKTKTGSIANAYAELTGENLGVGQYQDTTSKEAAVAIGVKSVAGDISLALGTGARAEKVNAVAIGTGATANRDNAIAIGGGSTTDKAATQELSTTVNGLTFKWSGGDRTLAGDVVSFGKAGYERQLKHVSPGKVSEDSTDAINGSQLHGVLSHLTEDPVFMFAADNSDKSNVVGDTPAKKQEDGKNKRIVARSISDSRLNILGGAEGNNLSDKNISVRYEDEKTLKIKLAKNLTELESAEFKNTGGDKTTINGDGVTITPVANGKKPVSVTKDGLNNGGNVIADVGGNLVGAKTGTTAPTTNATVPNNVDSIKNNAATVGDVLNAGWNLQNNTEEKDFVKPYDTVNFADGNGTTAVVDTAADRSTSKIKYNVNLGKGLEKDDATNKITVKTADKSLTVGADGVKAKTDNKTITTGDNGLKVVTGGIEAGTTPGTVKVTDGDNDKIATVDSVVDAVNSAAFTLKASADGGTLNANSTVKAKGELIKAGNTIEMIAGKNLEVKHNKNGKITFATVENPSFETVQIGDDGPKFSATNDGNIRVSDKDDTKPVKITNVKDGEISKTSKDAINGSQFHKLANNTIKLAGKNGSDAATETDAQNLNQQDGIKFTVKSSDGKLLEVTAGGDTITLTPKTGTITTTNGVPTANTTNGKLVTADQIVNALTEMGWKATADKDGTGTVTGTASELIKAGETVTFKAGDNLAIKQDGKNFIYSLNTALSGLTSAEFKDGNKNKVNITPTGITITKPADTVNNQPEKTVTLNQDGLNNGGNLITNVASNLDGAKTGTIEPTTKATAPTNVGGIKNNAATVGDVLNAGWNLQGNNKDVDFVKPYDTVNFINGDGTTATVETTNNKVSTVKYSVNLGDGLKKDDTGNTISIKPADKSLEVNKDGLKVKTDNTTITTDDNKGLKVVTGAIESVTTGDKSGTVKVKEDDTGKIATVDSVVNAVNSAAFTLKASATTGGTRNGSSSVDANGEAIKAGKTIEMIAGKNLEVTHNTNGKIIFATVDTPTFSTVQVGGDQGPKFSKTSDGDIKVSDKDGANPVKITNVKDGAVTDTSTDAINGSQFHKVANNTIKLAGQNGDDVTTATQTKEQNLNKQGGIKFTVKSSDGKLLEVKAADDTITLTPKTATITTGTDGVPTANTNGGKLVTADDLVTALKNMGWKAIAGQEGSGAVAGNAEQLIKAGETVTFKAGDNLKIKQDGKNFIYSLNPELTGLTKVEVKDDKGNTVVTTPTGTTITAKDGNETKVTKDGVTITPGKDDPANPGTKIPDTDKAVSLTKDGLNNGGNKITNVTSGLDKITTGPAKDLVDLSKPTGGSTPKVSDNTAATVGDLRNMGWVVSSDKTTDNLGTAYSEAVKNANEVKFVGKGAATVSGKTVDGVRTVTVDVTVPDVEKGTIEPDTGDNKGKVKSKAGDGDKFTTVDTVVNAINSAAWKATSGVEGTGTTATSGHTKSDEEIKAGDTVTFKAGDNLIIKQAGKDFTYSLAKELKDLSKVEVKDTSGNSVVTTPTGTTTTDGTNTTTVGPTGTITKDKDGNTTKVDGNGVTITPGKDDPANPGTKISDTDKAVSLTKDGLNNGGNAITNVAGNLEGAKKDTTSPKTNAAAPTNVDAIKNNAATVGDVLNAGWNLQNNGTAKDFVKPYDTVNFVDGENTKVVVETDKDGKVSTIKVNTDTKKITDNVPFEYTVKDPTDGTTKTVVKATDGKFYEPADVNPDGTVKSVKSPVLDPAANPNNKELEIKAKDKAPITNVDSGLKNYTDAPKAGLRDLSNTTATPDSNVATVGDLRNMGWVVSSDKTTDNLGTAYSEAVKNANEVKFVGTGLATVSGKTNNDIRTITVDVDYNKVTESTPFEYGIKNPTTGNVTPVVKATDGKYYDKNDLNSDGTPKAGVTAKLDPTNANDPNKDNLVIKAKGTDPQTVNNVKGSLDQTVNTGDKVQDTNGKLGTTTAATPITEKSAPTNVDAIYNNAATVGDVLNAGWNLQNNGTAKDFVKPYDTVNFVDGLNTKAIVTTDADGKVSNVQIDVKDLPIAYTNEAGDKVVKAADGKYYKESDLAGKVFDPTTNIFKNANGTAATQPTEVAKDAIKTNLVNPKAEGNKAGDPTELGNVKSGLDTIKDATGGTTPSTTAKTAGLVNLDEKDPATNKLKVSDNNVATVGDLRNMGWVVSSDKTTDGTGEYSEQVKNANEVRFVGKGTATVSGKTDDKGVRTITVEVNDQVSTNNSVTPVVYTKADGTKVYPVKKDDGTIEYHTTPDGKGAGDTVVPKNEVITSANGPEGTTTPTTLSNVAGNLDGAKTGTTAPTTNAALPNTTDKAGNNYINPNNAATVGDVLNAGWNLQNNGTAKDFVKPYDTVNFVNGGNTTAEVTTDADGKVSNVTYNVTGLPVTYTNEAGKPVSKVGDKYYEVDPTTGKPDMTKEVQPGDLKTTLVNPNPATGKTGTTDPSTLNNVKSGLDTYKEDPTKPETKNDPKNGLVDLSKPTTGEPTVKDNTAATVGDLRNLGWIVSSDKTTGDLTNAYADSVKHANEVKFVGKNGIQVSGKTDDKGVRTLTFEMEAGEVTPTEITKADGTKLVKVGDKVYNPEDIGTDGKPKQGKDPVGTIANDGKVYNSGDVVNGAPNNGVNPIDGITVTPNNGSKFVTGNQVADAIEKSGFVVGKNNKALSAADFKNKDEKVNPNDELRFADGDNTNVKLATKEVLDASGKVKTVTTVKVDVVDLPVKYTDADGNIVKKGEDGKYYNPKDLDEKVYDPATKTYKNADGSALAEQPTPKAKDSIVSSLVNPNDAKDGKVGTPSTLTNVANGAKTFDPAKDADGNDLKLGNDGKWYPADKIEANGTPKADAVPVATPVNPGKAGLVDFSKSNPTNAATVGDLRNMGWVVSTSDTGYNDQVRNTNKVDFKQGTGIKISGQTTADGTRQITIGLDTGKVTNEVTITKPNGEKVNAIKVTQPDGTVKYYEKDKDGKADLKKEVPVGTGANDNKVTADDGSRVVTGNAVATAIGESGWNVGKANTKDVTKAFETEAKLHDKVNPNDDVKFVDGDNTTVSMVTIDSQNDDGTKKATTYIKTDINKDIHIDSVTVGGKNADGTPGKDGALTVKDKNGNDRVKVDPNGMTITPNKADGTPDPDKAVSLTNNGLNNGGNNITNVKSNLPQVNDSAKKAYNVNGNPIANKNNIAAPITAADAADIVKKAGNNAATASDVLNAGWNLQENGSDRDFVKPYDTVNFVDGTNTKVTVKTNEDGTKSNVQINLVGLPIAFADKDGNRVVQGVKDGKIVYHKMLSDGTASKELVDPKNVQVTNVNPTDAKINTVGTPGATINNVAPAEVSPTSTQAVNGSQLYQVAQEINNVNNKVDKLGDRVNKGLAGAAAMSGIEFMEIGINQATVAAAVGGYRGTHAVAVGVQAAPTENTRVNAKMSLTPGSRTEAMYSVGAAYRFNLK